MRGQSKPRDADADRVDSSFNDKNPRYLHPRLYRYTLINP
jgi:hypothetical protein